MKSKPPTKKTGVVGRNAFLAHQPLVLQLLGEGWRASEIFAAHRDKFPFAYANFTRYIRDLRDKQSRPSRARSKPGVAATADQLAPAASEAARPGGPIVAGDDKPKTFTHNPVPDRDSLI